MLSLTTSNRVTFSVNVSGTASTPSVRCLVGEYPSLSFPAVKLANGEWEVMIDLPKDTKPGAHPFKIEVLLNGRLFTPINYSIAVNDEEPAENPVKPIVSDPKPVPMISKVEEPEVPEPAPDVPAPAPKPAVSLMKSMEQAPAPKPVKKVVEKVAEKVAEKVVNKDDPLTNPSLWKMQEQKVKPAASPTPAPAPAKKLMGGLEKLVKAPVSKLQPRAVESKPVSPAKISMLDVANEVDKNELKPTKKPIKKAAPTSVQESRAQSTPVSIKKGPVIYK